MQLQRCLLLVFTLFASAAKAQSFEDDAETGTVTFDETPSGRWDFRLAAPGCSFTSTAAAAHRGSRGLRVTDGAGGTSSGTYQAFASVELSPPVTGEYYLRFWFQLASSNALGSLYLGALVGPQQDLVSMEIDAVSGRVRVGGFESGSSGQPDWIGRPTSHVIHDTSWHLIEFSVRGVGTSSGTRELRIDGVQVDRLTGIEWGSWAVNEISLGEFWAGPPSFKGTLHYDDVRGDTTSHASSFAVTTPTSFPADECTPVTVTLESSDGQVRPAPYAFGASLALEGVAGSFFVDAACQTSTTTAAMTRGASSTTVYVKANEQGEGAISALYADFLEGRATVTITAPRVTDAGSFPEPDAGSEEDGGTQSGPDAGAGEDAGIFDPDAGMLDAGLPLVAPVAVVAPEESTLAAGEAMELDGSGSAAPLGTRIAGFHWELVEGPTFVEMAGHEKINVAPHEPGTYVFRLVVTDSLGRSSLPASARVIVEGDVSPPDARLGGCGCGAVGGFVPLVALGWLLAATLGRRNRTVRRPG